MAERTPPEVPAGWAASWNAEYQTWFYINQKTEQSQWEPPTSPVDSAQATAVGDDLVSPLTAASAAPSNTLEAALANVQISGGGGGGGGEDDAPDRNRQPEVPSGWMAKWSDQYETWFFYNLFTQESTWDKPTAPAKPSAKPEAVQPPQDTGRSSMSSSHSRPSTSEPVSQHAQSREDVPEVPSGWVAKWNDVYQAWFYINLATEQSSWERPTVPADRPVSDTPAPVSPLPLSPTPSAMHRPIPTPSPLPVEDNRATSNSSSTPAHSADPELPLGWLKRFNGQYQTWFYVNSHTGKSTWERPTAPAMAPEDNLSSTTPQPGLRPNEMTQHVASVTPTYVRNEARPTSAASRDAPRADSGLPAGWTARLNRQYQTVFYVNLHTRQSQWEKPTAPALPSGGASENIQQTQISDEELARRLQAEEDALGPTLPPRPAKGDPYRPGGQDQPYHARDGAPSAMMPPGNPPADAPPSYEFAVSDQGNGRGPAHRGPSTHPPASNTYNPSNGGYPLQPPMAILHPPSPQPSHSGMRGLLGKFSDKASGSSSRPSSRQSGHGDSHGGGYVTMPDGSLAPADATDKKPKKKRSWMVPAGVAAGGVGIAGLAAGGIYALTSSDIGDRIMSKLTGEGDEDGDIFSAFGDAVDAVAGE